MDNNPLQALDEFKPDAESQPSVVNQSDSSTPISSLDDPRLADELKPELHEEKFGTVGQMALTAAEGASKGILGHTLTAAGETGLSSLGVPGLSPEEQKGREEENPITAGGAEAAGFVGSVLAGKGPMALLGKAGQAIAGAGEASTLGARLGAKALAGAAEMGLLQSDDEAAKLINSDPNQSFQTAISNIGLSGLLGGITGGAFGGVGELWNATKATKMGRAVEDFKGRLAEKLSADHDPVQAVTDELAAHYDSITSHADEVYGANGLKSRDIARALPGEVSPKMTEQAQTITDKVGTTIKAMEKDPYSYPQRLTTKLKADLDNFASKVSTDELTPAKLFEATQDLKQTVQGYGHAGRSIDSLHEAYDFTNKAKSLGNTLKEALEDKEVWGKAAERQKSINKAFSDFLPSLKDFNKKFTVEIGGDKVIDPGKVATYMNQLGKPNAEIKQEVLSNFLKASNKYADVIHDIHGNLGISSPITPNSLSAVNASLKEVTPGMRMADSFLKHGLGKAAGAAVGASAGHATGSAGIGALIGEHALGPLFDKILPAMIKPLLSNASNPAAAKAAFDYAVTVAKGENMTQRAVTNLFKAGAPPTVKHPSDRETEKLNKQIQDIQSNPNKILGTGGQLGHYMPGHQEAATQVAGTAVNFLSSIRPNVGRKTPLDSPTVPSSSQIAAYKSALSIAQQPLVVISKMKQGTMTPQDVMALKTMYPDLYNRLSDKMTKEIINRGSKDQPIPYKTRLAMSMFMGQPLDSTMTPQSIISAQPQSSQSTQTSATQPKQGARHSMTGIAKLPNSYRTQAQTRQQDRETKD